MSKCSRMGPRLNAGKNVRAPTIKITPIKSTVKRGVVTGKVPKDGGTYFLLARLPAIASIGMIIRNRPTSIVMAPAVLYQSVFASQSGESGAVVPRLRSERIQDSLSPCGPGFKMLEVPNPAPPKLRRTQESRAGK